MSTEFEDKTFYDCVILNKEIDKTNKKELATLVGDQNPLSLPDMFHLLLHNQTIINEKLSKLLKK